MLVVNLRITLVNGGASMTLISCLCVPKIFDIRI